MAVAAKKPCSALAGSDWVLQVTDQGDHVTLTAERIAVVLQWEILQELKRLNALLGCGNCLGIPRDLRSIKRELVAVRKIAEQK